MGILDAPLRAVSKNLLGTFGTPAVLRQVVTGSFDADTDQVANSEFDHPVHIVPSEFNIREIGGRIKEGDKKILVAAAELGTQEPDEEWQLIWEGITYEIVDVKRIQATDQPAAFQIAARGA